MQTGVTMESVVRLDCLADCTRCTAHTQHIHRRDNVKATKASKFSRYIILHANFECTFAACARLSSMQQKRKRKPTLRPTDQPKIQNSNVRERGESRELRCIHLCVTLTLTPTLHLRFSCFLLLLASIASASSVTTSSSVCSFFRVKN